ERKAKEEAERTAKKEAKGKAKEEAERKAKEEAERKAKEEAERKAKEEAERKAKEEAERKAQEEAAEKREALKRAMRGDASGAAGIPGATDSRNQAGGGGMDGGYGAQVRNCIHPRVVYNVPPRQGNENPTLQYRVYLNKDGRPGEVQIRRSSGNQRFDAAVRKGIQSCSPFPKPPSGKYPAYIDGHYRMYD